jgi:hypothetical protein
MVGRFGKLYMGQLPKTPNHYIFTLKMATAVFAETLDNFDIQRGLSPKSEVVKWRLVCIIETYFFLPREVGMKRCNDVG